MSEFMGGFTGQGEGDCGANEVLEAATELVVVTGDPVMVPAGTEVVVT